MLSTSHIECGSEYADRTSQVNVNCCKPLKLGSLYSWVERVDENKTIYLAKQNISAISSVFWTDVVYLFYLLFLLVEISMFLPSWWAIQFGRCLFATWGTDYWFLGGDSELWEGWLVWCVFVDGFLKRICTYLFIYTYMSYVEYHLICRWDWYFLRLFSDRIVLGGDKWGKFYCRRWILRLLWPSMSKNAFERRVLSDRYLWQYSL